MKYDIYQAKFNDGCHVNQNDNTQEKHIVYKRHKLSDTGIVNLSINLDNRFDKLFKDFS